MHIKLTQGKCALVDYEDFNWLNQWKWHHVKGYAVRDAWIGNGKKRKFIMHREILSIPVGQETDHINRDTLDNRKQNLRIATKQQNGRNRTKQKNNTSGYKGVSHHQNKWQAVIKINKKAIYLGVWESKIAAALAYKLAERRYFGDFTCR
jgi:hypothetical protein